MSTGLLILTLFHTGLSIVALLAGIRVMLGLMKGETAPRWTSFFLITAIATSITGFFFPFLQFMPSHGVGVIALIALMVTLVARYRFGLAGVWRPVYVLGLVASEYFLIFVLVAQLFGKVPALHDQAPTGSEPPFGVALLVVLLVFAYVAFIALRSARRSVPVALAA
ncbi:MAG: hypothetical protein JWM77_897 [Rhodospirillales bacterium]|nr:hypothetical protein [Rhodospirillales bacterium]